MQVLSKWLEYVQKLRCKEALAKTQVKEACVEYGEEIYASPRVNGLRWLVTKFNDEYNVFIENLRSGNNTSRIWGACFKGRERAMAFALRMALVCSGKINRKDWHSNA